MMNRMLKYIALPLALAALCRPVVAEDIEIYMNPRMEVGSEPLVMFNIDYRANLGSTHNAGAAARGFFEESLGADHHMIPGENEQWTFYHTLALGFHVVLKDLSGVQVGLMLSHERVNNCEGPGNVKPGCSNGGYIAMGFRSLQEADGNGAKAQFLGIIDNLPIPGGNVSHSWQGKEIWFEFFRYLTGQGVYNGRNGYATYRHAPGGDTNINLDENFPEVAWDDSIMEQDENGDFVYKSPLDGATECTRLFSISFTFGTPNQEDDSDAAIRTPVSQGGMGFSPSGSAPNFQRVLSYMYDADLGDGTHGVVDEISGKQNVVGWFLTDNTTPSRNAIAAAAGTDRMLEVLDDPELLVETLNNIFDQILSVSTTFVAASVPVNVFNRSEIVDNVYIALFQADPDARPRWPGSLKKLKILEDEFDIRLIDSLGNDAVATDGRINFNALTFWTLGDQLPPVPEDDDSGMMEGRDGRFVERGGAGQKIPGYLGTGPGDTNPTIPGPGARTLFLEPDDFVNGNLTPLMPLNADSSTAASIQKEFVGNVPNVVTMIRWMRGQDVDDLSNNGNTSEARPWILGDPLHSRPLPVNYGARGGHTVEVPDIRILMGSNDGYMRMFRNTDPSGQEIGREVWGFMPRAVMYTQPTLRANEPLPVDEPPHPYTVDGAPVIYTEDLDGDGTLDGDDRVLLFFGLRRGGHAYYALDISDPDNPMMLWRITNDDAGFGELGLTFSTPEVGRVQLQVGVDADGNPITEAVPVLVFGGGYDKNKDERGGLGTDDAEGNAIFVVNANNGALIWKATHGDITGPFSSDTYHHIDMLDSIPSDTSILDTSGDGFTDRVYVGDSGGTVWRADLAGIDPSQWTVSVTAYLGRHFEDQMLHDRRFFHAPDIVLSRDELGPFDAVILGSGNRANPLDRPEESVVVDNFFYMIKDRRIAAGPVPDDHVPRTHDDFGDVTDNCLQSGDCVSVLDSGDNPEEVNADGVSVVNLAYGWRLRLEEAVGEKSLAIPFTVAGTIFFTTYMPPGTMESGTCGPAEGGGLLYAVALADARSVINFDTTDDDPDRPGEATTRADRTRELRSGGIPAEVVSLPPGRILLPDLSTETVPGSMRWRTFWYENEDPNG